MPEPDDHQLLAEYVRTASEPAFAALVGRYVNLVYSAALRSTGNPHQAEEITQAVFIILACKGPGLSRRVVLSGWLYRVARFTAANFLKGENRRRRREQEAFMQSTLNESPADTWQQLAPLLDEAMDRLGQTDRDALVLRYFENKTAAEIGAVLRLSEETARKRVNRALEKLHRYLARRGMISSTGAVGLAISSYSIQAAPPALAKTVAAMAVAKGAAASISTLTLIQSTLKIMAWTKVKTVIIAGACVLFAAGTTTFTVREIHVHHRYSWQVPHASQKVIRETPPQYVIVPTRFAEDGGYSRDYTPGGGAMGIAQSLTNLVWTAFDTDRYRLVIASELPPGRFDYFLKPPGNDWPIWQPTLQRMLKSELGLVGQAEMQPADVMVLVCRNPKADGLRPPGSLLRALKLPGDLRKKIGSNSLSCFWQPVGTLVEHLRVSLNCPVVDQTGLTNHYDFVFAWSKPDAGHSLTDRFNETLAAQFGMELVPTNMPYPMMVVRVAR